MRRGWNSDRFNVIESRFRRRLHASLQAKNLPNLREENCFSIVIESTNEVIDLVAKDSFARELWVKGLSYLVAACKNYQKENQYDM